MSRDKCSPISLNILAAQRSPRHFENGEGPGGEVVEYRCRVSDRVLNLVFGRYFGFVKCWGLLRLPA